MTTNWATAGTHNVTVIDDINYAIETEEYSRKISCYKTHLEVLGDNAGKGYALVLQHCPKELQT